MKHRLVLALLLASLIFAPSKLPAWTIQKRAGYTGPGDVVAFTAWYGLRGYSAALAVAGTTKMARLRNSSTNELCDILVATTGGVGLTTSCTGASAGIAASTFCSTGCRVQTIYDQVAGNACAAATCNLVQNTTTAQLSTGNLATLAGTFIATPSGNTNATSANNFTPVSPLSISIVASKNSTITTAARMFAVAGATDSVNTGAGANLWILHGTAGSDLSVTASDNTFHTGNGFIKGANSLIAINGVDSALTTVTLSTVAGAPNVAIPVVGATFNFREAGFVSNYEFTPGDRSSLNSQQRAYWGF